MDQKKSIAYQAMDELLKAQNTHVQLKRQFLVAKLNEELTSKRENFKQDEVQYIVHIYVHQCNTAL